MSYILKIGEAVLFQDDPASELRIDVQVRTAPDAPLNSSNSRDNAILPSYRGWDDFASRHGLHGLFWGVEDDEGYRKGWHCDDSAQEYAPLMAESPGAGRLHPAHLAAFRNALEKYSAKYTDDDGTGDLRRLQWLGAGELRLPCAGEQLGVFKGLTPAEQGSAGKLACTCTRTANNNPATPFTQRTAAMRYEFTRSPDATSSDAIVVHREAGDPRLTDRRTGWAPNHPAAHRLLYLLKRAMLASSEGQYLKIAKASTSTLKAKRKPCAASGDVPFLYVKNTLQGAGGFFVVHDESVQANEAWLRDGKITFRIERESPPAARKLAANFAKEFTRKFADGEIEPPNGGDCFFCSMFERASGGRCGPHVAGHVAEKYFVPSLLANAVEASGNLWLPTALRMQWQYGRAPSERDTQALQRVLAHYVEAALAREGVRSAADLPAVDG